MLQKNSHLDAGSVKARLMRLPGRDFEHNSASMDGGDTRTTISTISSAMARVTWSFGVDNNDLASGAALSRRIAQPAYGCRDAYQHSLLT